MNPQLAVSWSCHSCEVEGRDPDAEPICWNCGGSVTVTARPTVRVIAATDEDEPAQ